MGRTLIIGSAGLDARVEARLRAEAWDRIVAVDGGADACRRLGLDPAVVVGDLDSLSPDTRTWFEARGVPFDRHPVRKDLTDLELALHTEAERGGRAFVLVGVLGGRMDMTVTNVLLLLQPAFQALDLVIWHGAETLRLLRPPGGEVQGQAGDRLSLVPLIENGVGVVTEQLEYPLCNETLVLGQGRGISNVMQGPLARIRLRKGVLLLVQATHS